MTPGTLAQLAFSDPTLAEAHSWLAVVAMLHDWDWALAEGEFQRAVSLKPSYLLAQVWYAIFLGAMGKHDESIPLIMRAETIDPLSLTIHLCVGRCYFFARRYDEAIERLRATLEMEPSHVPTYAWIARAYCARAGLSLC
jgi:adenylate cyclase